MHNFALSHVSLFSSTCYNVHCANQGMFMLTMTDHFVLHKIFEIRVIVSKEWMGL
jgi:hypothetical protein